MPPREFDVGVSAASGKHNPYVGSLGRKMRKCHNSIGFLL